MEKSYIQKIIPFIDNMRVGQDEGGEPSSFDVNPLYNGQEIDDTTKFKINTDETTMLSVLESLEYEESGDIAMTMLWTFDSYPGLYVVKGFTKDSQIGYVLISDSEPEHGGLIYASGTIQLGDDWEVEKGFYNLDENDCYTFSNSERTITLGDQADKWNGIITGTPKD